MSKAKQNAPQYRTAILPNLGKVQVPAHLSDAQVINDVLGKVAKATPKKKTKKKL